jgi:hypothetical protein
MHTTRGIELPENIVIIRIKNISCELYNLKNMFCNIYGPFIAQLCPAKMFSLLASNQMKNKLLYFATAIILFLIPSVNLAQAPTLGSTANFVLFSTNGPLSNTGTSTLTGDVGTNNGTCSSFVNVNGVVHTMDGATALCAADLLTLYNQINNTTATLIPVTTMGNSQVITAGSYSLSAATILNGTLTLDGQGNSNAVFIIQVSGAFTANTGAVVNLINNTKACNVFWKVEGLITLGTGASMKGTFIANNAAINLNTGVILEGRALSTTGAVSVSGVLAYVSTGCGSSSSPSITTQPISQTACVGNSAVFSVAATGTGLTYQWRIGTTNLSNGGNISGATTATLVINPASLSDASANYNVVITGSASPGATSTAVSLVINSAATIIAQAVSQTICEGSAASFSVGATGTGLTYQWRTGTTNLANGGSISGATSAVLTINPVALLNAGTNYNVVITGACSSTLTSSNVSLAVNALPLITSTPSGQTLCAGSAVSFPVLATGTGLTYQWRIGTVNLNNGGTVSGATSATLAISSVALANAASNYNVIVSGVCSPSYTSSNISLVVNSSPLITAAIANQTACAGSSVSFPVSASGAGLTYQWRIGTVNLTNGGTTSGATSANLIINPVSVSDAATNYNVIISGVCSPTINSSNISLVINTLPVITTAPAGQTLCSGGSASFPVIATGTGLTYQWRIGTVNLINGGTISGATSSALIINPVSILDASTNYNVVVSGACSPNVTSINVPLVVNTAPIITALASQTVCEGSTANFPVTATGTGLIYQWRIGAVNLNNGGIISGANSPNLSISPVNATNTAANYNVVISGVCSPSLNSVNVALTVNSLPGIITAAASKTICSGSSVSFPVITVGTGLTYQWRIGTVNLNNGGNISGATSATLTINPATLADASAAYNVVVSGACSPAITSSNVSLVVNSLPLITAAPANQTVCAGGTINFPVIATGTGLTYQWRNGTVNLNNAGNISGATSSMLTINPVNPSNASLNYNVVVSGVCSPSVSTLNVSLFVNTPPVIITTPANQTVCVGSPASFPVIAAGSSLDYQWRIGTVNLTNGGNISGATSSVLTINSVSLSDAGANYNVVINGLCTPSITSANISLVVATKAVIKIQPGNQMAVVNGSVHFSVVAIGTGLTYQWRKGNVPLNNSGSISGANSPVLTINPVNYSDTASHYNVLVSGMCLPADTSINVILWVCGCVQTGIATVEKDASENPVNIYPNPFTSSINVIVKDGSKLNNCELKIYNTLGDEVLSTVVTKQLTTVETSHLPAGTYVYRITSNNKAIQTGKLISQ